MIKRKKLTLGSVFNDANTDLSGVAAGFEVRFESLEDGRLVVTRALSTVPFVKSHALRGV